MTNYEKVKDAVIEVVPGIVKDVICCNKGRGISGQMITEYKCPYCHEIKVYGNTNKPSICEDCAKIYNQCQWCRVVNGKDITFDHIMLWLFKFYPPIKGEGHLLGGEFYKKGGHKLLNMWKWGKSLEHQDEPTLAFLASLL